MKWNVSMYKIKNDTLKFAKNCEVPRKSRTLVQKIVDAGERCHGNSRNRNTPRTRGLGSFVEFRDARSVSLLLYNFEGML